MDYTELTITPCNKDLSDILIAELSVLGFESFEEEAGVLKAYIPGAVLADGSLEELFHTYNVTGSTKSIPQQNWNAVWEKDFQPVTVGHFCTIRATFHQPDATVVHEIVITPKMSFGTGHHATTQMMIQQMESLDFTGKKVLDFGTGTGVLAILAKKMGAGVIRANDTDEWSYENTIENIAQNNVDGIEVLKGSLEVVTDSGYDIILANINRHILIQYMKDLAGMLVKGGIVLMSGILEEDEVLIRSEAEKAGLEAGTVFYIDKWICMKFEA